MRQIERNWKNLRQKREKYDGFIGIYEIASRLNVVHFAGTAGTRADTGKFLRHATKNVKPMMGTMGYMRSQ
jgi:hypothetical protein